MLKISPAVMVLDVPSAFGPNNYTLFPDSENKNLYYALAERPTLAAGPDGAPSFNLTWYFGSGEVAGGICTLTVALPLPDLSQGAVRDKIAGALTTDATTKAIAQQTFELCMAMAAGDKAKEAALKAQLGLSEEAANAKKALFDAAGTWEQFLPAIANLEVGPIEFKSGTVTVQAFANDSAYQTAAKPEASSGKLTTTPSLMNKNAAVVTFNLKDLGANLFWHGMGGPSFDGPRPKEWDEAKGASSVIAVTYDVTFDGLLPAATATVTLDKSVMAKLNIEEEVKRGAWGRRYTEQRITGKEYNEAINNATNIVLPAVASKEDKDSVQKTLTDWAAKQLEEMVASQLPEVKLADLSLESAKKLSTVTHQSRTYKLTQAVTLPKHPQAQLPMINAPGILKPGSKLEDFFHLINLNNKPYFNVDLTVRTPIAAYLKARGVERFVVTQLAYCGEKLFDGENKPVSTLEYPTDVPADKPAPPSTKLTGTFKKEAVSKALQYSYLVAYNDGTPSYRVMSIGQDGNDNYLDLGGVDIGVLSVTLSGIDLPWDLLSSAKVDLQYGDWQKSVAIRKEDAPVLVTKAFGQAMDKALTYRLTVTPTAGAPVVGAETPAPLVRGAADIVLKNPLGDSVYDITFDMEGLTKAQMRVEYTMRNGGADRVFPQVIELNSAKPETAAKVWKVPAFSEFPSSFKVTKARVTADGTAIDLKDLSGGVVDKVEPDTRITVTKDGLSNF